ncbi:ABC transporter ATP-binding protein [bacterium RCC_150]
MSAAITILGLEKSFGRFRALDGLDLEVREGEVHGFLGPNGAGKSTTLRVLMGLLRADAGSMKVLGADPWRDLVALHKRIAYVPEDVNLWPSLTGGEAIELLGRLRGGLDEKRCDELIEVLELDPTKRGDTYSKGNRQKVAIIAALSSDAELLILDEPTSGLDPLMEATFREEIRWERTLGRTVLLSSHILAEVEALADRISIIRKGKVVETGSLEQMRGRARTNVSASLSGGTPADSAAVLRGLPGIADLRVEGQRMHFSVDSESLGEAMGVLVRHGMLALTVTPPSLEDLFLRHYGEHDVAPGTEEEERLNPSLFERRGRRRPR